MVVPGTRVEFQWNEGENSLTKEGIKKAWNIMGENGTSMKGRTMKNHQRDIAKDLYGLLQPDETVRYVFTEDESLETKHVRLGPQERGSFILHAIF